VKQIACLAAVYLMIERSVGSASDKIGLDGWDFGTGAEVPDAYSFRVQEKISIAGSPTEAQTILTKELGAGLPVIVQLSDVNNHFVLVEGLSVDSTGHMIAKVLDPFEGGTGTLDMATLAYSGPTSEKFVAIGMRTIESK